jgi:invasion protein IalB
VFTDTIGTVRAAVNQTFATSPNTPAPGLSLYRFSKGHGGLQCSACHGSTHAEFPTSHNNDNVRNVQLQGHAGVMSECTACHTTMPSTVNGGPHGMHPVGQTWVSQHQNNASSACQACHGTDYRGTVLSRMMADRTLSGNGTQVLFRGATVGCYLCHNGPGGSGTPPAAPTVSNVSATTTAGKAVSMTLPASGTGLTLSIISQPAHGAVGLTNSLATYFPDPSFTGTDTFTFAAYNGSKNSQLATGTVVVTSGTGTIAPAITQQPLSQTVTAGNNATFNVTATGTAPLSYQWRFNGVNIAGATASSLTLSAVTSANAGSYTVVISNTAGSITSAAAVLTVNTASTAPSIIIQPASQTVTAGNNVTISVVAYGTAPLSYQWRKDGVNIAGATASSLVLNAVTSANAGNYTVVISNSAGSITSAAATLTVNPAVVAPSITQQPVSQTVAAGNNVTFNVTATGTAPLSYQWRKDGVNLAGATSASLTLSAVTSANAGSYTVVISNTAGSITSAAATLTVTSATVAPSITQQPVSQTVTAGNNVTFSVTATGTAPLTYQWRLNGVNITGATGASLTLSAVTTANAGSYTVVISNAAGSVTSAAATLTVNPTVVAPSITQQPVSQTVTAGNNVTFSVTATGTAPLSYQWRKNGVNITGATSATLTLSAVTTNNAGSYTVVVRNPAGSVTSSAATLTVRTPITVTLTSPINGSVYTAPAYLRLTASVSGTVTKVQFFDGTTLLGTDTAAPYSITKTLWTSGVHTLTAKATTASGAIITSAPVQITVNRSNDD